MECLQRLPRSSGADGREEDAREVGEREGVHGLDLREICHHKVEQRAAHRSGLVLTHRDQQRLLRFFGLGEALLRLNGGDLTRSRDEQRVRAQCPPLVVVPRDGRQRDGLAT